MHFVASPSDESRAWTRCFACGNPVRCSRVSVRRGWHWLRSFCEEHSSFEERQRWGRFGSKLFHVVRKLRDIAREAGGTAPLGPSLFELKGSHCSRHCVRAVGQSSAEAGSCLCGVQGVLRLPGG